MMYIAVVVGMLLGAPPTPPTPDAGVPASADMESAVASVLSASGRLRLEVLARRVPLRRGLQNLRILVTDAATHAPVTGLQLTLEPWMPSMGHGIPETPPITATGPGQFQVTDLDLFMPGAWELRFSLSGAARDQAVAALTLAR